MKYLAKGELLILLGSSADKFTQFMLDPSMFGITEPLLTQLKIVKQKFDWTSGIDVSLQEIQQLMQLLLAYGIVSQQDIDNINLTPDNTVSQNNYVVQIIPQDTITIENQFGALHNGTGWLVMAVFKNKTKDTSFTENFYFDYIPTSETIDSTIANYMSNLKASN